MPEWPMGAGCKPVGVAYGGSNPPPPTISILRRHLLRHAAIIFDSSTYVYTHLKESCIPCVCAT